MMMTTMKLSAFYLIIVNCTMVPGRDHGTRYPGTMVIGIGIV